MSGLLSNRIRTAVWLGTLLLSTACTGAAEPAPAADLVTTTEPASRPGIQVSDPPPDPVTATATIEAAATAVPATADETGDELAQFHKWARLELTFSGPDSIALSQQANPFRIMMDVTFVAPDGRRFLVPAFYDGDGAGGLDGNIWKVRFTPDATGEWSYQTTSAQSLLDGQNGRFVVNAPGDCRPYTPGDLPDFGCVGRLTYDGSSYLKFIDGPYWLKGGVDDPEDFLAPNQTAGFANKEAAIDYLAGLGVNSIYMMLHNVGGDGRNVWPWVGDDETEARRNHQHFDVARLAEWEELFSYIQERGLVLHLVFEDDSAWNGFDRHLYYREMIARFGHHNGLYWNIAEEFDELYSAGEVKDFAALIAAIDPYDHPITVHHAGSLRRWEPFAGDERFSLTSFQTQPRPQNEAAVSWFERIRQSGRPIPISFDETGKLGPADRDRTRHIIWSIYLGGANFEMHTSPLTDYRDFAAHFADMTQARTFMESLPFWEMRPANELLTAGEGYLLARPGDIYAAYLPNGGSVTIDLTAAPGTFQVLWLDPRTGTAVEAATVTGGEPLAFHAPSDGDSVLQIYTDS